MISDGEMATDDETEMEDSFGWGGFRDEQAGAAKQRPYVRTQTKVRRNHPVSVATGKSTSAAAGNSCEK